MIAIDPACRTITIDGNVIRPPRRVFNLCALLAVRPGMVFTRDHIMESLGISLNNYDRSVDVIVKLARRSGVSAIKTSWGTGYFWSDSADP